MASNNAVGVDIGTRAVQVAHVQGGRGRPTLVNFAGAKLPEGSVREGEILDVPAVSETIRGLLKEAKIRAKDVELGVSNQRVVVRQVDLPWAEEAELRESLRFQVQEYIPIPVEEAELDVHILDELTAEDGERRLRVLLVAAQKDMIATHVQAVTGAGLRPTGIDLNPFAVLRVLGGEQAVGGEGQLLVDIGAGVTNILVHENGVPRFVRILVLGGDDISEGLSVAMNLTPEEADVRKRQVGLDGDDTEARLVIEQRAARFIDEIRSSVDYYQAQAGVTPITRVVLSGGGSLLRGLPEQLEETLRLPVEMGRTFSALPMKPTKLSAEQLAAVEPSMATAVGLALGGIE